jgi:hypothetical protein
MNPIHVTVSMMTRGRLLCAALAALGFIAGCSSLEPCNPRDLENRYGLLCGVRGVDAQNQTKRVNDGLLVGSVSTPAVNGPIVIFAYRRRGTAVEVVQTTTLSHAGPYQIAVPPGIYRIAAFEDVDENLRYDPARERAALYHDGGPVAVRSGESIDRLYLHFRDDRPERLDFAFALPEASMHACCEPPAGSPVDTTTR